ncbi:hypothetical protein E2C01_006798 [Portunus trituberculatus]|uniref:Uncharacterized protein n=1 Tax=Portunus trituberculatus TaxID=210409 RepID=A0A5B7D0N2_PORTR|nr:hypothetical protein [Portunus trituberculatus]
MARDPRYRSKARRRGGGIRHHEISVAPTIHRESGRDETLLHSDPHHQWRYIRYGEILVESFLHLLDNNALLMVGSFMLGQDTQERPQLEPPLFLGDAALPVGAFFQLNHRLKPEEGMG